MKHFAEIKRHRDDLKVAMSMPCGCEGFHKLACVQGMLMMKSTHDTLSWVLGENDDLQALVEGMRQEVSNYLEKN